MAVKPVIVLDFENQSGYGGALLGRTAADALALELPQHNYEVVDRGQVEREMAAMEMRRPYDRLELRELGLRIGVLEVITGEILAVRTKEEGRGRMARVSLAIEVYEVDTADLVNGGIGEGTSAPTEFVGDFDILLNEAVERAVKDAVQQILSRHVATGSVMMLIPKQNRVLLNIGARSGVRAGDEFTVVRSIYDRSRNVLRQQTIGRLRVVDVTPDDATAEILYADYGIETGDRIRQAITVDKARAKALGLERRLARKPTTGLKKLTNFAIPLAMIAGLFSMGKKRHSTAAGARNAYLYQEQPGQDPVIRIHWHQGGVPAKPLIFGWTIYRDEAPRFAPSEQTLIDVLDYTPEPTSYDDERRLFWRQDVEIAFTYISTQLEEEDATYTASYNHYPPEPGRTYWYKVRRINTPTTNATTFGTQASRQGTPLDPDDLEEEPDPTTILSDPTSPIGPVTYLLPPVLQGPDATSGEQRVDRIEFRWEATPGATEYVLEIFARDPVGGGDYFFQSGPIVQTNATEISFLYDKRTPGFRELNADTRYFWRVGARNGHEAPPQPRGYVYSDRLDFRTSAVPPPPP